MSLQIPESVLEETKMCPRDFACLATGRCGDPDKCEVSHANGRNVLFLTSKDPLSCPYRISFADSLVCRCPTHYAIHQRWRS